MESFVWIIVSALSIFHVALAHEGHDHRHHQTQNLSSDQRLPITIYYESLCPDSTRFFKEQLEPAHKSLGQYINIEFVPYGKANQWYSGDSYQFECQHGPTECYGNIVQACAVNVYHDEINQFNYLTCLMTTVDLRNVTNATYPVEECAVGLDVDNLKRCIDGPEGLRFLSIMGNKTTELNPKLQSVPAIAVNTSFSYEEQDEAVNNLKSLICTRLKAANTVPEECTSSAITAASSILLVALASLFITTAAS
ncbi:GILT-like protein 1 [Zootermopsis nevadensis]|uniref:GILT-like protein C02D5.2 n=1 Tax=Zootermopsis nevadensis TaxID=136037 RepID=A0A067R6C5_ZOONE|nr:GILT-like protein 1 [Zootermopsis nevadensis]KDR14890.1 GILT-like protein C02D5.2 [Zootermopsis nevadensis]